MSGCKHFILKNTFVLI